MREVLADAASELERGVGPRHHVGRAALVDEQAAHARITSTARSVSVPSPAAVADELAQAHPRTARTRSARGSRSAGAATNRAPESENTAAVLTSLIAVIEIRS